jgi:two-component system cell cycle sensor histidine kinase/response regulator CckA
LKLLLLPDFFIIIIMQARRFSFLWRFFAVPDFADPDRNQTARQIFSILKVLIVSALILQAVQAAMSPHYAWRGLGLILAIVAFSLAILALTRRGLVRLSGFMLVGELWMLISLFSWTASGLGARAAWGYFIVVFIAGMLLNQWAGIGAAAICSLSTLVIALFAPIRSNDPVRFWLVNSLYLLLVLLLQNLAGRSIRESLARAHRELHERKLAENELRTSDERFKQLSSLTSEGIMIQADGVILDVNQAFAELVNRPDLNGLIGKRGLDVISFTPESRQRILAHMSEKVTEMYEVEIIQPEGSLLPVETHGKEINYFGRTARLVSMRDISDRKRAEREKEQVISLQKATIESTADGILVIDRSGKITDFNQRFTQMWRIPASVLSARDDAKALQYVLDQLLDPQGFLDKVNELYAAPEQESFDLLHFKDGRCFERYSRPQLIAGQPAGRVWSFRDVSERRLAEKKLQESEQRYRTLFESAGDAIFLLNPERIIIDCNSRTLEMFGHPREQIIGMHIARLHPARQPDGSDSLLKGKEKNVAALAGESQFFEWRHVRVDGTFFDAEVTLNRVELGSGMHLLAMVRDISQRKKLEEQLRQAQKMEAIGILAGGVAHDFNNILSTIVGYGSLLQRKLENDEQMNGYIERILGASERAANLTSSLLAFSRKQEIELLAIDLNDVIYGFHKILARLIGEDIDFKLNLASRSLVVDADVRQIEQVLMNLANNSRDAMPRGGRLTISTAALSLDPAPGDLPPGSYAAVAVADSGLGMEKEVQAHIFEPFFTTKEVGKGTGLGLAIVYGIVKNHGGVVAVDSTPGRGTTFTLYLPLKAQSIKKEERRKADQIPGGSETILLIEDDPAVRQVTRSVLEEFGYSVLEAADGIAAQDIFRKERERIGLVLCDLIMPKLNGRETVAEIRKMKKGVRAIFMSGYTAGIIADKGIADSRMHLLLKPLNPGEMLSKIRAVLDGR